jgi:hypothetical protein
LSLALGALATPPADVYAIVSPAGKVAFVLFAAVVLAFIVWVLAPRLRADPTTRFFALGGAAALVPISATFPADRLLMLVGFGGSALVATVLGDFAAPIVARRPERILRGAWIAIHLFLAPLLLPITSMGARLLGDSLIKATLAVHTPPEIARQTLVFVNSPAVLIGFAWMFPADPSRIAPARMRGLSSSFGRVEVKREDARTLLDTTDPAAPSDPTIVVFRDSSHPVAEGDVFRVPGLEAEIVRIDPKGGPFALRYRFDVPLEDPSFRWVAWDGSTYVDYSPPAVGASSFVGPG